jgi:hypothetical protein
MEHVFRSNGIVLENPSWTYYEVDASDITPTAVTVDSFAFTNFLQTKLLNLSQEVRSPEFNRQALLALYDCTSLGGQVFDLAEPEGPQLYDAYGVPIPRQSLITAYEVAQFNNLDDPFGLDVFSSLVAQSNNYNFARLLLLHFFSFLIDRVANYWNQVEKAREALRYTLVLIALRCQLKCGFVVRSLHTPLRLSRRSIHPIETAAQAGC